MAPVTGYMYACVYVCVCLYSTTLAIIQYVAALQEVTALNLVIITGQAVTLSPASVELCRHSKAI